MKATSTILRVLAGAPAAVLPGGCDFEVDDGSAWVEVDPAIGGLPEVPREFRGVWVASVANIDWPSRPDLSSDAQRKEAVELLDLFQELRLNAVLLQVRPSADALYDSPYEPWSEYLVGEQGGASDYDPLRFWIEESRARAIDLHVWVNPFRARHREAESTPSADHVSQRRPDLVHRYGEDLWLDPGEPEAQAIALAVIEDLVRRYDVDGVHVDDYFYPYPIADEAFPDDASYDDHRRAGGELDRSDWRRLNIDRFVREMYARVKSIDREVLVGISPFGIWRPGHPEGVAGLDAYEALHADSRLWMRSGWLDYSSPQLYWPRDAEKQPFVRLLEWWADQNTRDRHLWPGLYLTRIEAEGGWPPEEIEGQIEAVRASPDADGVVLFSAVGLVENRQGVSDRLAKGAFSTPALVPPSPWLFKSPPARPSVRIDESEDRLHLQLAGDGSTDRWIVQWRTGGGWETMILSTETRELILPTGVEESAIDLVRVQAISKVGEPSEPIVLRRRSPAPLRSEPAAAIGSTSPEDWRPGWRRPRSAV